MIIAKNTPLYFQSQQATTNSSEIKAVYNHRGFPMRQSSVSNRASHVTNPISSSAAASKLMEKKKEYEAVSALERASTLFLERIEALGEDCNIMADAGEVHGQVLSQWPKMFQILTQFLAFQTGPEVLQESLASLSHALEGQRLVRIPIEELRQAFEETPSY